MDIFNLNEKVKGLVSYLFKFRKLNILEIMA